MLKKHPVYPLCSDESGVIYSIKTGQPRKLWKTRLGYMQLSVGRTSFLAHRIVADCWIPNPENKPEINHINGIKDDNRVLNLEWVTRRENIVHARDVLGIKFSKPGFDNSNATVAESHVTIFYNLWREGFSIEKIAKLTGFCGQTVERHMRVYRE